MLGLKNTITRLSGTSGIPLDAAVGLPEIRISGMRTLTLEPHRGLRAFAGDCILVETGLGLLCIRGSALVLKYISSEGLCVYGEIVSIEMAGVRES
jgi:sporulation protein YqfC